MTKFETLFGIKESQVKNTCVLLPLLKKEMLKNLGVKEFSKGRLYSSGNSKSFTAIQTGIGPGLSGDAALYLAETQCQNIILFGSCGLVKEEKDIGVGSLVVPEECYSLESFTDMLLGNKDCWQVFSGDKALMENFLKANKDIKKLTCATLGSLKLEEGYIDRLKEKNIKIVEMECSALFSASKHTGKKAMALFYVTDIIHKKPFYKDLANDDKMKLSSSIRSAADILCDFIEKNLSA
ncbi:MAG: hypothetical protein KKG01_04855 [Candidatus Omnitrophica bacterium]|nr:hypothetical protein [Candidatus Omnitrophota bacterium]